MKYYRADLHIHTVLSPCGDLEMSPVNIVTEALKKGLDIIGITDHNTTRHCELIEKLAKEKGIFVMPGAEVTTKEEVHCLAFFENTDVLKKFQTFLDENLPDIPNNSAFFGYQVQVDENDIIIYEEKKLLINAISKTMKETETFIHSLNGIFIPAHIDRMKNSIYSQLGFIPEGINADALEISGNSTLKSFSGLHPEITGFTLISNSDAHYLEHIGKATTKLLIEKPTFNEFLLALKRTEGRDIVIE
jgi:3',5'-nucleoside bisphosphate phosphatase